MRSLVLSSVLSQEFFRRDTTTVARELLGKILCHKSVDGKILKGKIVETEAYLGIKDPAAHSFGDRRTQRTQSMYLDGGHSYIYLIYGMYFCLNVVTRKTDEPEAVLIRAIEPMPRPPTQAVAPKLSKVKIETNGPGKLCRYLGLTKQHDGLPLWDKSKGLWILDDEPVPKAEIVDKPRVGVDYAGEAALWPLRFYLAKSPYVSKE